MMAQTYHNCKPGNWYGFGNTSDLNVGQTVQVQFGAWDDGSSKLNIYLARPGGSLVDPLVRKSSKVSQVRYESPSFVLKRAVLETRNTLLTKSLTHSQCGFRPEQLSVSCLQLLLNMPSGSIKLDPSEYCGCRRERRRNFPIRYLQLFCQSGR